MAGIGNYTQSDFVIILAGTNNIEECVDSVTLQNLNSYKKVMAITQATNVIVSTVPFRLDKRYQNGIIEHINHRLYRMAQFSHINIFCINNLIHGRDYIVGIVLI